MKSVALVGFAAATRDHVRASGADEIWSLNMIHSSPIMRRHFPLNIDRLFELHPIWMLKKPWYSLHAEHWEWLRRVRHHYPVYMVEAHPDVHNSRRYPLEQICERFLSRLSRADEPVAYFTSSFCYMIALALYEGFDRIECYGFEMGSDTEYVYQKAAAEFWLGIALGLGKKVWLPQGSLLLRANLYGFEDGQLIPEAELMNWMGHYRAIYDDLMLKGTDLEPQDYINLYLLEGAINLLGDLIKTGDATSRQVLESYKNQHKVAAEKNWASYNALNARVVERHRNGNKDDTDLRPVGGRLIHDAFAHDGAFQVAQKLIARCDLQDPPRTLKNRYRWHEIKERT